MKIILKKKRTKVNFWSEMHHTEGCQKSHSME